ncbi:aldo/keto reductase [Fimbriimonas ginsengisoli]|uniref:Aldo/keto reductase n=1 Tax=Fimbriimonas ginsengisoli Gsoil 348 TaxID=661478 RepID=A0A068NQS6_FIMGI|nr:aldo/keto reductase [Fimbriimonas ginsengisoli]AIE85065.1 aldo/keto reductase [Fimbriimonas ginsengisoli Gsoil 348]
MTTGTVPYLDKPVSRIVCGTDFLMGAAPNNTFAALDAYWEAGGRTFDSAHCYGANSNIFAAWTGSRGVRDEVIYFDKGCHPYGRKRVTREDMRSDILDNHRRLERGYTDFFVLHRDDPEVPVGEIVDWLNEFKEEGLIGVFGGSNWEHTRIAAANEYAQKAGKQGFSLNNPNLTLAENVRPLWDGCLTIGEEGRRWHAETNFPLFAWSSTARGYFAGVDDPEVLRAYDSETNRARRARCEELGKKYGMSTVQMALAWTLSQPGNIFALCGLRTVDNVKQNVEVTKLKLSPEELRYLEFGEQ